MANTVPTKEVGPKSKERMEDTEEKDQKSNFEQLAKSRAPRTECAGPENLARHDHQSIEDHKMISGSVSLVMKWPLLFPE